MNSYENVKIVTEKKLKRYKIAIVISFVVTVFCLGLAGFCIDLSSKYADGYSNLLNEYSALIEEHNTLQDEYTSLYENYSKMYEEYVSNIKYSQRCEENISKLSEVIDELNNQNVSLVQSNDEYFNLIQQYEQREELFDKYEYAIIRTNGTRTDITYDQLINLELLAEEKEIDTDLVLSIAMVESSGTEDACNNSSSARGYGQIVYGTGKMVYEKIMNEGKYNHDYALDGDTNFKMMVNYLRYLEDNNSSIYTTIRGYRGEGGSILDSYIRKINNYLSHSGKSIATLK